MLVSSFFGNVVDDESTTFDEGPPVVQRSINLTSSIDTSTFDAYRQGVEITTDRHYSLGTVKIYSGEPFHAIMRGNIGQDRSENRTAFFAEPENSTDLVDDGELFMNAVLEPFSLRTVGTSFGKRNDRNRFRGTLQSGNERDDSSDQVSVSYFVNQNYSDFVAYNDSFKITFMSSSSGISSFGIDSFVDDLNNVVPFKSFEDATEAKIENVADPASLQTYVAYHVSASMQEKNASTGFAFDSKFGLDSIAFGGMTY